MNRCLHTPLPIIIVLALSGCLLPGCARSHALTTPTDPGRKAARAPQITAVHFINGELTIGESAQAAAEAEELAIRWYWDFGDGAMPAKSSEVEPVVQFFQTGKFTGKVQAGNAFGTSEPFRFTYVVGPRVAPEAGELMPSGLWYASQSINRFTLPIVEDRGQPAIYEWHVSGGDILGPSSNSVIAMRARASGKHSVTVRASNQYGAVERTAKFTILRAPELQQIVQFGGVGLSRGAVSIVPMFRDGSAPGQIELRYSFTKPAIANRAVSLGGGGFFESSTNGLTAPLLGTETRVAGQVRPCAWTWVCGPPVSFSFEALASPTAPSFVTSRLPSIDKPIYSLVDIVVNGNRPQVAAFTLSGDIFFATALSPEPRGASDWQLHQVGSTTIQNPDNSQLLVRSGRPLITVTGRNGVFVAIEAKVAAPTGPSDWEEMTINALVDVAPHTGLAVGEAGGLWAIRAPGEQSYEVHHLRPGQPLLTGWETQSVATSFRHALPPHLVVFEERPLLCGIGSGLDYGDFYCIAGRGQEPTSAADWFEYQCGSLDSGGRGMNWLRATSERVYLLYRDSEQVFLPSPRYLTTQNPLGGPSAWVRQAPALTANYQGSTILGIATWRGRPLQIDNFFSSTSNTLALSRGEIAAPQSAEDWVIHVPDRTIGPAYLDAVVASDTHLYLAGSAQNSFGSEGSFMPVVLWTREEF